MVSRCAGLEPAHLFLSPRFVLILNTMSSLAPNPAPALSPCIGICRLGGDGLCVGCLRTGEEIGRWSQLDNAQRLRIMQEDLPMRRPPMCDFHLHLPELDALRRALHPLDGLPVGEGWNVAELADLLPPGEPVHAAVLAGLVPRPAGTAVLLTRRNDGLRNHAGQVSFPGGRVDPGDVDVIAAAIRETGEEIAIPPRQLQPLGYLDPFVTVSGFRVVPVVAVIDPAYQAFPNPGEVAEVFEVPLDYLMDHQTLRHVTYDWKGRPRTVLEYDWPGQRIWGATASILYNLRQRLEATA
jgi:8-oxo-dGTP pyrophosphatase MutT (NUDIX family)/predicted Fe-S protein YdhL (DUF1289 family)